MSYSFSSRILGAVFAVAVTPILAQDAPEVKVMRVDKFEFEPEIVTPKIAKCFDASPAAVESRLKGSILATLSQELSSTKLLSLAVRDDSLRRLAKEWKVSEELGSGKNDDAATGPSVDDASYLAYAKVEDLVAVLRTESKTVGGRVYSVGEWKIGAAISLEVTTRKTGTKKVLKEEFEVSGNGSNFGVDAQNQKRLENNVQAFDAAIVRKFVDGISKKLGMRVLDVFCPTRIINVRGNMFIVDRGRAAGMKEGQIVELTERGDDEFGTDAGFPLGKARVKSVKEETSVLELVSTEGAAELAGDRAKLTITRPLDPKVEQREPVVAPKVGPSKKSK